jgi:hypothetical protein
MEFRFEMVYRVYSKTPDTKEKNSFGVPFNAMAPIPCISFV